MLCTSLPRIGAPVRLAVVEDIPLSLHAAHAAVGSKVDVKFKGGRRLTATLLKADENSIGLKYTALEAVEGKKKKERVEHEELFSLADINSVTP